MRKDVVKLENAEKSAAIRSQLVAGEFEEED